MYLNISDCSKVFSVASGNVQISFDA